MRARPKTARWLRRRRYKRAVDYQRVVERLVGRVEDACPAYKRIGRAMIYKRAFQRIVRVIDPVRREMKELRLCKINRNALECIQCPLELGKGDDCRSQGAVGDRVLAKTEIDRADKGSRIADIRRRWGLSTADESSIDDDPYLVSDDPIIADRGLNVTGGKSGAEIPRPLVLPSFDDHSDSRTGSLVIVVTNVVVLYQGVELIARLRNSVTGADEVKTKPVLNGAIASERDFRR